MLIGDLRWIMPRARCPLFVARWFVLHTGFCCGFIFIALRTISLFSAAYKHADGKKIDGKRVLVDVERARTVKGWLPRRLGKFLRLKCSLFGIYMLTGFLSDWH